MQNDRSDVKNLNYIFFMQKNDRSSLVTSAIASISCTNHGTLQNCSSFVYVNFQTTTVHSNSGVMRKRRWIHPVPICLTNFDPGLGVRLPMPSWDFIQNNLIWMGNETKPEIAVHGLQGHPSANAWFLLGIQLIFFGTWLIT